MARSSVSLGPSLPIQFYEPIGRLVAVWARLEDEIDLHLEDMHRCPAVAALGKIPLPFKMRADRLKKAALLCFADVPALVDRIIAIAERALQFGQDRNLIVHGRVWFSDPLIVFDSKREIVFTVEFVQRITHGIAELTVEIAKLNRPPAFEQMRLGSDGLTPPERAALEKLRRNRPSPPHGERHHRPMPPSVARAEPRQRSKKPPPGLRSATAFQKGGP